MWQKLTLELNDVLRAFLPYPIGWLTETQNLTQKLKDTFSDYQFQLVTKTWRKLNSTEIELFGREEKPCEGLAYVRSVLHKSGEKTLVNGFSIVPKATYDRLSTELGDLGDRPIGGALLYGNPRITRSDFYFQPCEKGWQRASIFSYLHEGQTYPLMVLEQFVGIPLKCLHDVTPSL